MQKQRIAQHFATAKVVAVLDVESPYVVLHEQEHELQRQVGLYVQLAVKALHP